MQDLTHLPFDEGTELRTWFDQPLPIMTSDRHSLPRHQKSSGVARAMLRDFLRCVNGGELFATAGELVLSELVANAVLHGRPAGGQFGELIFVRFEQYQGLLYVEVHDGSEEQPTVSPAREDDESGRGLWLVEQLSLDWGYGPRDGIGKRVWAVIGPAEPKPSEHPGAAGAEVPTQTVARPQGVVSVVSDTR
ncbi:ATP-binding protein [Kitasatospora sp. RB6PN24]|uniref:ATP-binding protein n=1 Tax=Kitasatospora humi TaxID=2893891 RepID=UPI001E4E8CD6|nr:ATP-binding protein [Kitasatospora humi]MCC9305842.1 ATP-binding protein [Kitasatospora humi]